MSSSNVFYCSKVTFTCFVRVKKDIRLRLGLVAVEKTKFAPWQYDARITFVLPTLLCHCMDFKAIDSSHSQVPGSKKLILGVSLTHLVESRDLLFSTSRNIRQHLITLITFSLIVFFSGFKSKQDICQQILINFPRIMFLAFILKSTESAISSFSAGKIKKNSIKMPITFARV